ncbi:MAG: RraA family protein [Candidatus Aminicenantaceae bacterium]
MRTLRFIMAAMVTCSLSWGLESGFLKSQESHENELSAGKNFIRTQVYSLKEDLEVLKLFEGLRVADVSDGMDKSGLHSIGLVNPKIHTLWKDTEHFSHRIAGIAVTARYVPTQRPPAGKMAPEEFERWEGHFYTAYSSEPFVDLIRKGTVLVIDDAEDADVGTIGSYNIMDWASRGCVGVVTDGCARDTDEIIIEKIPLYFRKPGRGIRPGRNEIESVNRPVSIGGVLVMPGDVIVADGDGVIVVPRKHARKVALFAREIMEKDMEGRKALYKKLGLTIDDSVRRKKK